MQISVRLLGDLIETAKLPFSPCRCGTSALSARKMLCVPRSRSSLVARLTVQRARRMGDCSTMLAATSKSKEACSGNWRPRTLRRPLRHQRTGDRGRAPLQESSCQTFWRRIGTLADSDECHRCRNESYSGAMISASCQSARMNGSPALGPLTWRSSLRKRRIRSAPWRRLDTPQERQHCA